ncbi:restriction endonuclease subunit S [Pseudoflavonifractor phocaeensis]|uniref:restriction endonuclease subunit S n=1 Tax=Pseudoflavonifractor phocaeensis TaxID=1870988 RepID=UPI00195E441C|nr:restriction endonuclease subunit S [Pseudoflavonifractor phocaeensis]MBM6724787.1 restriction endonuclease subunit S [Pseudoflavonifractor phocaeensis]
MEWIRLGDIASKITKGTTPTSVGYDFIECGINFVKVESITENRKFISSKFAHISEECNEKLNRSQLKENDILFSIAGVIGRTAIVHEDILPANTNQALAIIRVPNGRIDYSFLAYALESPMVRKQYEKQQQGVAQINVSLQNVGDFLIPRLELEEQRRIAALLDKVSDLIAKRRAQLDKLDLLVKARFVEMFGDPQQNVMDFPLVELGKLGEWNSGGTPPRANPEYFEGDINWYSAGELNTLYLNESVEKITYAAIKESAAKLFKAGSMLVGMYDTAAFKMGILRQDSASNQACACLTPNNNINVVWLYYELQLMKNYFLEQRRGVRQKNLNLGMIKNFKIPLAKIDQQKQFSIFVDQIERTKTTINRSLDKLETLKKALMQQYFG